MGDRVDKLLERWRAATEHVEVPAGLTDAVQRAILVSSLTQAIRAIGRPALFFAATLALGLVALALGAVRTVEQEAAEYAIVGGFR